jgi:hypothetical protein
LRFISLGRCFSPHFTRFSISRFSRFSRFSRVSSPASLSQNPALLALPEEHVRLEVARAAEVLELAVEARTPLHDRPEYVKQ